MEAINRVEKKVKIIQRGESRSILFSWVTRLTIEDTSPGEKRIPTGGEGDDRREKKRRSCRERRRKNFFAL